MLFFMISLLVLFIYVSMLLSGQPYAHLSQPRDPPLLHLLRVDTSRSQKCLANKRAIVVVVYVTVTYRYVSGELHVMLSHRHSVALMQKHQSSSRIINKRENIFYRGI